MIEQSKRDVDATLPDLSDDELKKMSADPNRFHSILHDRLISSLDDDAKAVLEEIIKSGHDGISIQELANISLSGLEKISNHLQLVRIIDDERIVYINFFTGK